MMISMTEPAPASKFAKLLIETECAAHGEVLSERALNIIAAMARGQRIGPAAFIRRIYAAVDRARAQ